MPRQVRIEYPGARYHVMSRGNRREHILGGLVAFGGPNGETILAKPDGVTVRPGGSWTGDGRMLNHDGVHANGRGNTLIAELIARASTKRWPGKSRGLPGA